MGNEEIHMNDENSQKGDALNVKRASLGRRIMARFYGSSHYEHWVLMVLAILIGAIAGYAAIGFYQSIDLFLSFLYGADESNLATVARGLPWWHILGVLVLGGLIIGQLLRFIPDKRPHSVPHAIEAAALYDGHMDIKAGLISSFVTLCSLGVGASAGREGPVVHLGATLASGLTKTFKLSPALARTLLGCGVAAAVAASFNAPLAGMFFALEVIIGHYALHAFTPIVISAIVGTLVSRTHLGDSPAFSLSGYNIVSFWEFPAFFILGIVSALVAISFMSTMNLGDKLRNRITRIPYWLHPAIGGLLVGLIALLYPEVLSVGYEATSNALKGIYDINILIPLIIAKIAAVAISLGSRFGGGVFSPSLFIGAMTGGTFGILVSMIMPGLASDPGLYAIVGMGAVASCVLGAPISTMLIVFELTGDYSITIAVMIASAISSMVSSMFYSRSFFLMQLANRGVRLEGGRATYLLKSSKVIDHITRDFFTITENDSLDNARDLLMAQEGGNLIVTDSSGNMTGVINFNNLPISSTEIAEKSNARVGELCDRNPPSIYGETTLEEAMTQMEHSGQQELPVLESQERPIIIGVIRLKDVMREYNRALLESQGRDRKVGDTAF